MTPSNFNKILLGLFVFQLSSLSFAKELDVYSKQLCPPDVQKKVDEYCSNTHCGPLFNDQNYPIKPGYVEKIKAVRNKIAAAAEDMNVSEEHIVGALLTVQVKMGYRVVKSGNAQKPNPGTGAAEAEVVPNPGTGAAKTEVVPNPGTGAAKAEVVPNPGTGAAKTEVVPNPGTGAAETEVVPSPRTGAAETKVVPNPGTGAAKAEVVPNPGTGAAEAEAIPNPGTGVAPAPGTGSATKAFKKQSCSLTSGYGSLSRLGSTGPMEAEEYLMQKQMRDPYTCEELKHAINVQGQDILYLAAMLARNEEIFSDHEIPAPDLGIAVTLYGLADIPSVADRVSARPNKKANANSWGLYAECQKPLIEEILSLPVKE